MGAQRLDLASLGGETAGSVRRMLMICRRSPGLLLEVVHLSPLPAMAKPRLDLRKKKDVELKSFAEAVVKAMQESEHFAEHQALVEEASEQVTEFSTALAEQSSAEITLRTATKRKQAARKKAEDALTTLAALASSVSRGDAGVILDTHMPLRRQRTPVGHLPAPGDLRAEVSDFEGACDLTWDRVQGSSVYEVEFKLQPQDAPWQRFAIVTPAKARVKGLTPGVMYYFRVRAIGTAGPGTWSDVALCRAP